MSKPNLRAQSGQAITEAVLILVLFMSVTMMVGNYFKDQQVLKKLISGPWVALAGMLQNGIWAPAQTGALAHPNAHGRHMVITGEEAK